jgi:hypothetical protein
VKTENPSACLKCVEIAVALQLPVVPSCVNKVSINPTIQSQTPSIVTPTRNSIYTYPLPLIVYGIKNLTNRWMDISIIYSYFISSYRKM